MAWIAAAGSFLTGIGGGMSARNAAKDKAKTDKALALLESLEGRRNSQFNSEQDWYYKQLERKGKERGLEQFRKFSTVKNFAPNYVDTSKPIVVPAKPVYNQGAYANPEPVSNKKSGGGGAGGIIGKLFGSGLF